MRAALSSIEKAVSTSPKDMTLRANSQRLLSFRAWPLSWGISSFLGV
jgi:hypothetical protein